MDKIKVNVQRDHLERLSSAKPHLAIAELLWNGLDADATVLAIDISSNPLRTESISLSDNGSGFARKDAQSVFGLLGGSWKSTASRTVGGRIIHGKDGQGRFKAFSLGDHVEWAVSYKRDEKIFKYTIQGTSNSLTEFNVGDESHSERGNTGVKVTISNVNQRLNSLSAESLQKKLAPIFASYLTSYKEVKIDICGQLLDINSMVSKKTLFELDEVLFRGNQYPIQMEIIEWIDLDEKGIWLCTKEGFPLGKHSKKIRGIGDFSYSAYLKTEVFQILKSENSLELEDMTPEVQDIVDRAAKKLKDFFQKRFLEQSKEVIDSWKKDEVYPYKEMATSPIEEAERQVFEIVALNVRDNLPSFEDGDKKTKAFQLMMLRRAVENSPEELKTIMSEVLNLPRDKQEDLSDLLKETRLSSVISVSKKISDRLKTITALEEVLFNREISTVIKERSQLHKILEDNIWMFGEGYTLSVSDQSLTEVLRAHTSDLEPGIVIDDPVLRIDGSRGIVDLMLSRVIPTSKENVRNHLVIELKAPDVKIGKKELDQIESYANAVAADSRFQRVDTTWEFYIISKDLDEYAKRKLEEDHVKDGAYITRSKDPKMTIYIKTWAEVLQSNRFRLGFIKDILDSNFNKEDSLKFLKEKYIKYTGFLNTEDGDDNALK